MSANTKLTAEQKVDRKEWLKELHEYGGDIGQMAPFTVAKVPEFEGSKMACFSVAVCSNEEQRFRRKVGEYHALRKMNNYKFITLPAIITAQDLADTLYTLCADIEPLSVGMGSSTMQRFFG